MSKISIYLSLLIIIFATLLYGSKWRFLGQKEAQRSFHFEIPQIPAISQTLPSKSSIGNFSVWGLKPPQDHAFLARQTQNQQIEEDYIYKKINGIPSICKPNNENYRWAFYGILIKNKRLFAIFYNPALKKIKLVGRKESIDKGLIIKQISNDQVCVQNQAGKVFTLKIFTITQKETS